MSSEEEARERFRRLLTSEEQTLPDLPEEQPVPQPGEDTRASWHSRTPDPLPRPALDKDNMPLPRRVDDIDMDATRVTPAAYSSYPTYPHPAARRVEPTPGLSGATNGWRRPLGCFLRGLIVVIFLLVGLGLVAGSILVFQYYTIARSLPGVDDLRERSSQFETTRILDREGRVLYEVIDPNAGRRTYVTIDKVSPYVIAATLATEDKDFYNHPGFDLAAMLRALWQNYTSGEIVSGASTITQQLARTLLLDAEERYEQSYTRKAREIMLAYEIERRYTKDEILELYLNEANYGNHAYGIEAAAETYFKTGSDRLTLPQASFLAGLPQAPAVYDIYNNRDASLNRHKQVLVIMFQLSQERGCIDITTNPQSVCVEAATAAAAAQEIAAYQFPTPDFPMDYPHWVNFVRAQLETMYDPQTIYRSGFTVTTSLDPRLQDAAQQMVSQQVATLVDRHVTNGALVAIRPATGEILAMVGSADYYNADISGQVNMANSPTRQPGSSIKPITYVAAFEKGWTPATLIWDVPTGFPPSGNPDDPREPYQPVNYDERFHGGVTVRTALANSYNLPAVKTLHYVGIYDDPDTPEKDGMIAMAARLGITSLTRDDYGLSLTLGGGDVSLLDMTSAFSVFANSGQRMPPVAILKIVDHEGRLVYEYKPPRPGQTIRAEHAYLITSILSDNDARRPMFGPNSVLNLPFPVAAKTGTTNDFRDNWTLGYTPDLAVGVWVGNADYTPMQNTTGLSGAAPIWAQFMQYAVPLLTDGSPSPFVRPAGITDKVICSLSGSEPSQWCTDQRSEIFAADQPPLPAGQDLWRRVHIDTWTGLEASPVCNQFVKDAMALRVSDKSAREWLKSEAGKGWLEAHNLPRKVDFVPERECRSGDPRPTLEFAGLVEGQDVYDTYFEIYGIVKGDGFRSWKLEVGLGAEPLQWAVLVDNNTTQSGSPILLYAWDLTGMPSELITLRLYMENTEGGYAERRIHLNLQLPPPPDPPTPSFTPEPPTDTPAPTDTPEPTETLEPSATP